MHFNIIFYKIRVNILHFILLQFAIVLLCAAAVLASPDAPIEPIPILRHDLSRSASGEYSLNVETGDGTAYSQHGTLHPAEEGHVVVVAGHFTYIGTDGRQYTVHYTADENGYHPVADHLPVAPAPLH